MPEATFETLTADWPTYYGIKLSDVGEDGDVVVLGHHDTRRVIAALNRHARKVWGERSLVSSWGGTLAEARRDLMQRWGRFVTSCEEPVAHERRKRIAADGACWRCQEIAEDGWAITWAAKSTDEGAFPITHWSA